MAPRGPAPTWRHCERRPTTLLSYRAGSARQKTARRIDLLDSTQASLKLSFSMDAYAKETAWICEDTREDNTQTAFTPRQVPTRPTTLAIFALRKSSLHH